MFHYSSSEETSQLSPIVAPYWAHVDLSRGGEVFYRISNQTSLLERAQGDILQQFSGSSESGVFLPTSLLVVTWFEVMEFQGGEMVFS